jgi:hypothetical protein
VPALGPDGFDILAMNIFRLSNGCPYVFVVGHVQDPLTAAVVERSSGSDVTATTAHGYFEAWWPGTALATSVLLTTSAGVTTSSGSTALTHGLLPGAQGPLAANDRRGPPQRKNTSTGIGAQTTGGGKK